MLGNDWTYQQDGARFHTHHLTQEWCATHFPDFIPETRWPPNSPDLYPLDYSLSNELAQCMNWDRITTKATKNIKINLNVPFKSDEQKDIESVHQSIDEDRIMVTKAAIGRIMKAIKTSKHALLIQEVIEQLTPRFKPKISLIKKCIDVLIEGEYLKRKPNEKDMLLYVSATN
ncbi:unnamed protein product [Rotaria magnacalcarata]|uniref:Cullin neddylation domain-containing protein n=4 Tax=Rotaria magnacalcarata TaxID=392030 RepID=A0A8S2WRD0_9BILA|nr:unnamed protein product [Rotaria magnacalcarata]